MARARRSRSSREIGTRDVVVAFARDFGAGLASIGGVYGVSPSSRHVAAAGDAEGGGVRVRVGLRWTFARAGDRCDDPVRGV